MLLLEGVHSWNCFRVSDTMQREGKTSSHRVETPDRHELHPRESSGICHVSRSRDRSRSRSRSRSHRDTPSQQRRCRRDERSASDKLRVIERQMAQERERLRDLQRDLDRERERMRRTVSNQRDANVLQRDRTTPQRDNTIERQTPSRRRLHSPHEYNGIATRKSRTNEPDYPSAKGNSPTFTTEDVANILNSLKNVSSQPSTSVAPIHTTNNHKNILPEFDPSSKNQRIDIWLKKVNECAKVYGWDDKTTIHFAMQKLQGLAKIWYESLPSILFNWPEWQDKLLNAFPCEQNYGQALEDMLKRRSRFNEPIEVYFYEKLALLNQCNIEGKRAVDCIIHGLTDKTIKSSAISLRCLQPEQLLQFLMSNKESFQSSMSNPLDRSRYKNKPDYDTSIGDIYNNRRGHKNNSTYSNNNNLFCFNCKEKGHPFLKCPKTIIKCEKCNKVGHKTEDCYSNSKDSNPVRKTLSISNSNPSSKFYKEVTVNNDKTKGFVDFGSEVSLIKQSYSSRLGLLVTDNITILKGFGHGIVHTLGTVCVSLTIDSVNADVVCQVVSDQFLDYSILIGQSFTEQSHVAVCKTPEKLCFFNIGTEMPFSNTDIYSETSIKIFAITGATIYGSASIRAVVEPQVHSDILIETKIIGTPSQQLFIFGGVYSVKNGLINVYVSPVSTQCEIRAGTLISRGLVISVVNNIVSSSKELCEPKGTALDRDKIHIGESVDDSYRQKLFSLLDRYQHCFASSLGKLGCTNVTEMAIELNSNKPVVYRPYRLSMKEREHVRDLVKEMLDARIIRESVSEYASPIILVRKKDGNLRMCVDYRMLNSITIKERYPMPNIDDEIARLSGQAYFVTLDLTSGYYQVPISEKSRPLTSFVTPDGQYEFNRMPFGLANAPAVFQRMMHKVLGPARYDGATAYIDDILIYGKNIEECLTRLENVLKLLENANLTLNLSKCEFLMDKISYLGYEISATGIRPGDKKIQCVLNFPCPTDQHTVRQFLGLVGYFRKFIRNFASLSHPLTKLLTKNALWTWTHEQMEAFKTLKDKLIDRPILAIYDPAATTELHTDASKIGVGGVLLQKQQNSDSFRPIAFYSRKTSPEEKNFHAFELETLAVICSLKKFRVYLLGQQFKVVTDCSALRATFSKRDILPRVARWWLLMQEFDCSIEYRPGTKMTHVDALSRNPIIDHDTELVSEQYPSVMIIGKEDWLHTLQIGDSELCRIRDILSSNMDAEGLKYIRDNFLIKDNKLYRYLDGDKNKIRWVVPKGARWQICRMNHDDMGHFGIDKTLERIRQSYWFSKMSKFVKKYVNACIECAYAKKSSSSKEGYLHPIEKIDIPFHTLHVDHLGPFIKSKRGNSYLLVIVDGFTKFVFAKPVRNTKTLVNLKVLEDIFYTFRIPDRIISDRGTCFTSHAFKRFCLDKGIRHVLNAVASPRSNGQVERYNRTILSSLTAQNLNGDDRSWDDAIGKVQWGLNNTCQKTTGRAPVELMFGTLMTSETTPKLNEIREQTREVEDLTTIRTLAKDAINAQQEKQKEKYDKGKRPARQYVEGELVKITKTAYANDGKSKKLLPAYTGPFRVVSILGNDRYRVAAVPGLTVTKNKRQTTVAADRMLPWVNIAALELNECNSTDNDDDKTDNDTDEGE